MNESAGGRGLDGGGVEERCFGCGQHNERGLRLRFRQVGVGAVEAEYQAPEHFAGAPGVVHGGIQAALLDETLGFAVSASLGEHAAEADVVTVDFRLRYRRPAPVGPLLRLRGRVVRSEGRDYWAEGELLDETGKVLTRAEARWRRVG